MDAYQFIKKYYYESPEMHKKDIFENMTSDQIVEEAPKAWATLELTPGAKLEEVRKAYKRLILKNHPDRNRGGDAREKAKKINDAYGFIKGVYFPGN